MNTFLDTGFSTEEVRTWAAAIEAARAPLRTALAVGTRLHMDLETYYALEQVERYRAEGSIVITSRRKPPTLPIWRTPLFICPTDDGFGFNSRDLDRIPRPSTHAALLGFS
jgi:hypothetical protein